MGAATAAAGGWVLQRARLRRLAGDPEQAMLSRPPVGRQLLVRASDGTMLHAEVFGEDGRPTILFAHGWTEARRYWIYQIRDLVGEFRVVSYDLRGHGESEPAAGDDYSFDRFGDDVEAVLAASLPAGERAVLVGHSMGAMSIAAWAERHDVERRAAATALLNTGIGDLIPEQLIIRVPRIARRLSDPIARHGFLGSRARIPRFLTPISSAVIGYVAFAPDVSPAKVAFYEQMLLATPSSVRASSGIAMADMHLEHALANLTVPTLVMCGELDKLTPPSHARRMAAELPDLHALIELPATGHMGPLERPDEVSAAIRALALRATGVTAALVGAPGTDASGRGPTASGPA